MNLKDREFSSFSHKSLEEFKKEIIELENLKLGNNITIVEGSLPILISAPHVIEQNFSGITKKKEPFTKAIALYLSKHIKTHAFINNQLCDIDPNCLEKHEYTDKLISYINNQNIQLVIDIHGANEERPFDVDIGTLDGITANADIINSLISFFNKNNLLDIKTNFLFKGGGITQKVYNSTNSQVMQLEINAQNRMDFQNLQKVIKALVLFIKNQSS